MPKIIKKTSIWRKRYNLYLFILWFIIAIYLIITSESKVSGILYLLLAVSYLMFHIYNEKKGRNKDYIQWDDQAIEIGRIDMKPLEYLFNEIQNITVTPNNLIIKSGAAGGIMVELKCYSNKDLELLKSRFASVEIA